jgi:hypothetical protein
MLVLLVRCGASVADDLFEERQLRLRYQSVGPTWISSRRYLDYARKALAGLVLCGWVENPLRVLEAFQHGKGLDFVGWVHRCGSCIQASAL